MRESFGRLLQRFRVEAGLSQEQLAERAGLSTNAISSLERGLRLAPHSATLDRLVAALRLDGPGRVEMEEAAKLARAHRIQAQGQQRSDLSEEALHNLPPELTSFVDREKEVPEIKELLRSHRLVTVAGAGGAGKTRCAIKVARDVLDGFADGVWFADFSSISDPALVPAVIKRALSLQEAPNRPILETLLAYLKRKRLLLVLDNCEHIITEARSITAAILCDCPNVRILATSRENLNIAGELPYRMPSLPVPEESEPLSPQETLRYGAMQLFSERALSARSSFRLTAEIAMHVADICRRLDGIPLAIELAAARINVLSPRDLARKLDERFRLLTADDRSTLPRHRTMRALIDWSYDLLSESERRMFRRISIFAGGFTLESCTSVCGDGALDEIGVLDLLSSLVDKSLVQVNTAGSYTRYRLLESTRQYAREKLRGGSEEEVAARGHACAFVKLAEQLHEAWEMLPDSEWHARAEPELDNFREVLAWAFGPHGDSLLGQRLAVALLRVWYAFSPAEGRRWLQTAQEHVSNGTPAAVVAALHLTESSLAHVFGLQNLALESGERALALYRTLADPRGMAHAERVIAISQLHHGEIALGEALALRSVSTGSALGLRKSTIITLAILGHARLFAGDLPESLRHYREALTAARAVGAEHETARVALSLAYAECCSGNAPEALRLAEDALPVLHRFRDVRFIAQAWLNITKYFIKLGRYDEALRAARKTLSSARDLQWSLGVAAALERFAAISAFDLQTHARDGGNLRRAARIIGYVDSVAVAEGVTRKPVRSDAEDYDALIAALRGALGEDELQRLMFSGKNWSEDQAVSEAMSM